MLSGEFQKKYPSAKKGIKVLGDLVRQLRAGDIAVYETPFLFAFAAHDAGYTRAVCSAIVTRPATELSRVFHYFLNAVEAFQPHGAMPYAQKSVASRNEMLCHSVTSHLDWMARQRDLTKRELVLLSKLLKSSDVSVAHNALSAIRWIGNKNPNAGIRLLLSAKWGRDSRLASAALACVDGQHGIPPEKIHSADVRRILKRLEIIPNVESWEFNGFLSHASACCPDDVVKLFVNRIKRSLKQKFNFDERPIPDEFHYSLPDLSKSPHGANRLREIRDLTVKKQWQYQHFGRDLFWALAPFDFCLSILNEWIESTDEIRFKAALSLLYEAESDFIFSKPGCVEFILTRAQQHSMERFELAKSALLFCATRHGESRAVGQPGPTTLATKGRAAELVKKHTPGSLMAEFYQGIVGRSEARLAQEKLEDEERLEGE